MKFTVHLCTHARTHIDMHVHTQMQDSLPGTRQQCTAKWDVWEPPAAKRRTGRRNKPCLMETWHARQGGNSNKRLMGHGAFGAAAKYPPLLAPLTPPLSLCRLRLDQGHVGRERLTFPDKGPNPEATYFCLNPILRGQDNIISLNATKIRKDRLNLHNNKFSEDHWSVSSSRGPKSQRKASCCQAAR